MENSWWNLDECRGE
jgi:hypothetical protein